MKILRKFDVPTGNIIVAQGEKEKLEFLSLGDYGKEANIKSRALNITRNIDHVPHQTMLPLEEKWVITVSTQYGCSMGCNFCDVPRVGPGKNVTYLDLINQVLLGIKLHPEVTHTDRLNIHFARMGEPTWNPHVLDAAGWYYRHLNPEYKIHPVVSTIMPRRNEWLKTFIHTWMRIKNRMLNGNAGLQISINSTDERERELMFGGNAHRLEDIARIMDGVIPVGRKITLNFAVADYQIDPSVLLRYFNPELYICKLTPMHKTETALRHNIQTAGDYCSSYPYAAAEQELENAGYDVLVFVASNEEDESRITCGNAILAGTLPECEYQESTS
jgi:23S rRNA (adenine2503-C2)-methyltransferase